MKERGGKIPPQLTAWCDLDRERVKSKKLTFLKTFDIDIKFSYNNPQFGEGIK